VSPLRWRARQTYAYSHACGKRLPLHQRGPPTYRESAYPQDREACTVALLADGRRVYGSGAPTAAHAARRLPDNTHEPESLDAADDKGDGAAPPTIYDVARAAGVSIASVSRVLNGRRNPRPETRDRVQRAVAELGFVPDSAARALSVRL